MAPSLIRLRQEAERARAEAYEASLRQVSQQARPAPDFQKAIDEAKRGFEASILRDAWAWRPQMKTRNPARLRLAAARHLFARYPVAEHLEQVWMDSDGLARDEVILRKRWYIVAAGGGSLYKEGAGAWLTRKEVHVFLNAPPASASRQRFGGQLPVPTRTIPALPCGSRIPRSQKRRAAKSDFGARWRASSVRIQPR
jgi:hypothetical protein